MRNLDAPRARSPRAVADALAALLIAASACSVVQASFPSDDTARPAQDTPDHFVAQSAKSGDCPNTMVDPRNGVHIELVRSSGGTRGDYAVPGDAYGVRLGQLLRLSCTTGSVIGLVRR